jgi:prevent-host-death family protein
MSTVPAFEAKTHFSALLDRVENGEEIVITRHGKAVAKLIAAERPASEAMSDLLQRIRARREAIAAHLRETGQAPIAANEIVGWIKEGRRY